MARNTIRDTFRDTIRETIKETIMPETRRLNILARLSSDVQERVSTFTDLVYLSAWPACHMLTMCATVTTVHKSRHDRTSSYIYSIIIRQCKHTNLQYNVVYCIAGWMLRYFT